jgi:two-component system, NtrC family, response regulator HydG
MKNILIIDDDKDFRFLIQNQLKDQGFHCFHCGTKDQAFNLLQTENIDIVLCDLNLRKETANEILEQMKDDFASIPVIIITGYSNVRSAVELMRLGAVDYLLKPLIPAELAFIINKKLSVNGAALPQKPQPKAKSLHGRADYVFSPGAHSKEILDQINLVAPTNYSVIIYGESGSGKEAYAQEIHKRSKRKNKPFLAIDCGALSKELSASILFGHEKGAFTGAIGEQEGAFESAEGGTVFLDEISNLPYEIQVSLLRVMQERTTRRVGGTRNIPIDVRIVVASNKRLWESCRNGEFREDLYHRFNEFAIEVKPLRDRKSDILFYALHFLNQSNAELGKNVTTFAEDAINAMLAYAWPGNLRELRNLVRRSVLITESNTIGIDSLPVEFSPPGRSGGGGDGPQSFHSSTSEEQDDYQRIVEALQKTAFDKLKASALLGMDITTINKKIKSFADARGFKITF